jgi:ATP-dependent metalloprotease
MVTSNGMSPELGNVDLSSNHDSLSPGTKQLIENEVRRLIEDGRQRATKILSSKRKELDYLAKALLSYETLNREEAFKVIKGETLEGRTIMPSGPIKVPVPTTTGSLPEIPKIPGSGSAGDDGNKGPPTPAGGAVA